MNNMETGNYCSKFNNSDEPWYFENATQINYCILKIQSMFFFFL